MYAYFSTSYPLLIIFFFFNLIRFRLVCLLSPFVFDFVWQSSFAYLFAFSISSIFILFLLLFLHYFNSLSF